MDRLFPLKVVAFISSVFTFSPYPASAVPLSFTAVELLNSPNTTIESGQYSIQGTSFRVLPEFENSNLLSFSFDGYDVDPANFGVRINITRQSSDFDPFLLLNDGELLFGGEIFDNGGGATGLGFDTLVLEQVGEIGLTPVDRPGFDGYQFVPIGSSVTLDLIIRATPFNTFISGRLNGGLLVERTSDFIINSASNQFNLVVAGGGPGEDYVINSLAFLSGVSAATPTTPPAPDPTQVPEPGTLGLMFIPLAGLLLYRRQRA